MARRDRLAILCAAMVLTGVADVHAQTRDARAATRGTAAISGTVMSDEPEPRPVRRVRVTCGGPDISATVISDDRGRFTFTGLKPGRYTIGGTKDAWVPAAYGAKRPGRPGSAIPVAEGQTVAIVLKMLRGSVITGVLLDANNQPVASISVGAMRYVTQNGTRRLAPAGASTTDDRGVYRIYGLAPGDYYVGASARTQASLNAASSELRLLDVVSRRERTVAIAPTYFPGTQLAAQATRLTLGPGEERDGIDFALQLVATARVEGTVTMTDGVPAPPGTQVVLILTTQPMFLGGSFGGMRSAKVGADGAFSFVDVPPGAYTVLARAPSTTEAAAPGLTHISWASSDISVDGEPIAGLSLGLQPGMTLSGQLRFDGSSIAPPADFTSIRVGLQPAQPQGAVSLAPSGVVIDRAGRFVITGIIPGTYRFNISFPGLGRPGGWHARSAMVAGQDTLDVPIAIRPNQSIRDAVVTLSDRPAQLSGTVQNAGGAANEFTVILFPADQSLWLPQSRRIHAVRPSADGAFMFRGLPAGDYLVAAIDDVEPNEWFDPALLQRLLPGAMRTAIADGEHKVQEIRLGGGGSLPRP